MLGGGGFANLASRDISGAFSDKESVAKLSVRTPFGLKGDGWVRPGDTTKVSSQHTPEEEKPRVPRILGGWGPMIPGIPGGWFLRVPGIPGGWRSRVPGILGGWRPRVSGIPSGWSPRVPGTPGGWSPRVPGTPGGWSRPQAPGGTVSSPSVELFSVSREFRLPERESEPWPGLEISSRIIVLINTIMRSLVDTEHFVEQKMERQR